MSFFYIFMVIVDLLIPISMLMIGIIFLVKPPKNINHLYGYRTFFSMKNEDTWKMAHKISGIISIVIGVLLLLITPIMVYKIRNSDINYISLISIFIVIIQCCFMGLLIGLTEFCLSKIFDKDGNRK